VREPTWPPRKVRGVQPCRFPAVVGRTVEDSIRIAYDTVAPDYSRALRTALAAKPFDRAMLATFSELIMTASLGPVADIGCGPGHITAFLNGLGLDIIGMDLSSKMVAEAKKDYPTLAFVVGSMGALAIQSESLGGITAWYSIIHTRPARLAETFEELSRVLVEGGYLALAFQVGNERLLVEQGYGHRVALEVYRLEPNQIEDMLGSAGLVLRARLVRQPDTSETVPQAYLIAQKVSA
jgi:ubiquinone/menaquinone biosynthesis C-methylase UbiE